MAAFNVFYDIETLTTNTSAAPPERLPVEYVVAVEYDRRKKHYSLEFPNLYQMVEHLLELGYKKYNLIAHNGDRFDGHFLRRMLIDTYNLKPLSAYNRNSIDHELEFSAKSMKGDYLLESRVKAKTNLQLNFRIGKSEFKTVDTLPKFQASIKTVGMLLYHAGLIGETDEKLDYDYTKYDVPKKLTKLEARQHALEVFRNLTEHEHHYVHNDVHIMYMGYVHFNELFPNFDIKKRTLSQNVLKEYLVNDTAYLQILNKYDESKIQYTDYEFDGENFFDYAHHFYKGGLNFYCDTKLCQVLTGIVHVDLNSSYPYAMSTFGFPTLLLEAKTINDTLEIEDGYFYMVKISKQTMNKYLSGCKSRLVKQMFTKYLNNTTGYVYLLSPQIKLLGLFLGTKINNIPVVSYLKWKSKPFGGKSVIDYYYNEKVEGKKKGYSAGEIYVFKVILNGIYGIPALRAYFNIFKYDYIEDDYENNINGFKNTERNIVFAAAVTSYAFYDLLLPLTNNVSGIDTGFIYCDTDSLFLTKSYWDTIADNVKIDKYELGAWDMEHKDVKKMYVLNHKKYCILAYDKKKKKDVITVHAGGITEDTFNLDMSFEDFIETQFHDGAELIVKKHNYTNDETVIIYQSKTVVTKGSRYPTHFTKSGMLDYNIALMAIADREAIADSNDEQEAIYYETPFGAISVNEAFPAKAPKEYLSNINELIMFHSAIEL